MKLNKLHHKLTFVIIPEAGRSVYRIRLSRAAAYAGLAGLGLILAIAGYVYLIHTETVVTTQAYKYEMHGKTVRLEQDVASKNQTIEELKNEIFQLSQQAEEIKAKVEEMKKLESHLKGDSSPEGASKTVSEAVPSPAEAAGGIGGPAVPVSLSQVKGIASETRSLFTALGAEMNTLQARLTEAKRLVFEKQLKWNATPTLWPTASRTITSPFGYRKDPFTAKLSFHRGIDIAGKTGDPVYATAEGIVRTAGFDRFHGNNIVVEHAGGLITWYMHLNKTNVKNGDKVHKGQLIGLMGSTGRSTGPHLHYEVQLHGKSTNPQNYLPPAK
ncbi:peptidoglycan DD-metalloendopeptidase family protein [Paenibacillus hamazuiensis]|uniref:peptidoglycan DD-metalloendopeptidase family protein n=1 Tax=Paenibacillus hamazuiensis TaxID=2936508 RepID=UPI00200D0BC1|nr:peptidoglycan DD-metalloendopeptidase family protein [Paenibacillus hamazuiensis]